MTTRTNLILSTPGVAAVELLGPNEERRAAVFSGVQNGQVTLSPSRTVADGQGIVIQQGDPPFALNRDQYG